MDFQLLNVLSNELLNLFAPANITSYRNIFPQPEYLDMSAIHLVEQEYKKFFAIEKISKSCFNNKFNEQVNRLTCPAVPIVSRKCG